MLTGEEKLNLVQHHYESCSRRHGEIHKRQLDTTALTDGPFPFSCTDMAPIAVWVVHTSAIAYHWSLYLAAKGGWRLSPPQPASMFLVAADATGAHLP